MIGELGQLPIVSRNKLAELKFTGNSIIVALVPQPVCCMHLNDETHLHSNFMVFGANIAIRCHWKQSFSHAWYGS